MTEDNIQKIFDPIRKRWYISSPEEIVRQTILQYLIKIIQIPLPLINVESYYRTQQSSRRFDIITWKKSSNTFIPWLLVECKAPNISFDHLVQHQLQNYLTLYPSQFVMLSNGSKTFFWEKESTKYSPISTLPVYSK